MVLSYLVMQVTIVILNWNGKRFLAPCLDAVLAQTFRDFEIVLVDNGSSDGSVQFLQRHYPQVRLIVNQRNLGFAAANNQAIRASGSEFVATLNNDTEVEPGWLEALVATVQSDSQVGMCASKMLFAHRRDVINSAGIALDRVGIAWDRLGGRPDDPTTAAPEEVFGPCAGAALYRRQMLDEIGLFNENLPVCEDYDLWLRISCRYPVHLITEPLVIKEGGHEDQLSSRYWGMDRFRIHSIAALMRSGHLDERQLALAQDELGNKCRIYANGCLKRGKWKEAVTYFHLPEIIRDLCNPSGDGKGRQKMKYLDLD